MYLHIFNIIIIIFSFVIIIIEIRKLNFSLRISYVTLSSIISFSVISFFIYINTHNIITASLYWLLLTSELIFANIVILYVTNLSKIINYKIGAGLFYLALFYCASPIAFIAMCYNGFPNELLISNCFISVTTLILILKYSVYIVISKDIKNISLFHQLFLLLLLMTGSIFSFANFNYSINIVLGNISTNIKIMDYIFLYSSIFTLNYDSLVLQIEIDKLLASISMIYSYFFISIVVATIITRLKNNYDNKE